MEFALKISKASNTNVIVYNIIEEIAFPTILDTVKFKSNITGEDTTKEAFIKEIYQVIKNEIIKEFNDININTKVEVEIGYPPEKILKKIKEDKCELIVIGTIGLK